MPLSLEAQLRLSRFVRWNEPDDEERQKRLTAFRESDSMENFVESSESSSEVDVNDYEMAPVEDREQMMDIVKQSIVDLPPDYQQRLMSHWESVNPEQFLFYNKKSRMSSLLAPETRESEQRSTIVAEVPSEVSEVFRDKFSRISLKPSIMTVASKFVIKSTKSRFRKIKPEYLQKRLDMKTSHEYVRDAALKKLTRSVIHKLNFIRKASCCYRDFNDVSHDHKRVFSWDEAHFHSRRNIKGTVWIEILQSTFSPACLDILKFKKDVEEILRFMNMMFLAFDKETQDEEVVETVVDCVEQAYAFLDIYTIIETQYTEQLTELTQRINKLTDADAARFSDSRLRKRLLEEKLVNYAITHPIKHRYEMGYNEAMHEEYEHETKAKVSKLERAINECKNRIQLENYCFQCIMNSQYTDIENLKDRIGHMNRKYDKEFGDVENSTNYIKINKKKMKNRKRYLEEELEYMRQQVEEITKLELDETIKNSAAEALRKYEDASYRRQQTIRGV